MRTVLLVIASLILTSGAGNARDLGALSDDALDKEWRALVAERNKRRAAPRPTAFSATSGYQPTRRPFAMPVDGEPSRGTPEAIATEQGEPQRLFIRSNPLDSFAPLFPQALLDGKGASFTFTANNLNNTQSLNINGYASYLLDDGRLGRSFRYAVLPFVYGSGSLSNPQRPASEKSALQAGADVQVSLPGLGFSDFQLLGFRPYYQSDFRGDANIYGFSLLHEAYKVVPLRLGGRPSDTGSQFISWYWRALPELNYFHVNVPGRTNYIAGRDYTFLGGTLQFRSILFDQIGPGWLANRFYFNASVTKFWDLSNNGRSFHDSEIEFGYKLSQDTSMTGFPLTTSISLLYSSGFSRLTYEKRDFYRAQLSLQY